MRHSSQSIPVEQRSMEKRHVALRRPIIEALEHGEQYPLAMLARLQAKKFYSDLFESLLGAVWVDSGVHRRVRGAAGALQGAAVHATDPA